PPLDWEIRDRQATSKAINPVAAPSTEGILTRSTVARQKPPTGPNLGVCEHDGEPIDESLASLESTVCTERTASPPEMYKKEEGEVCLLKAEENGAAAGLAPTCKLPTKAPKVDCLATLEP
ncbi:hypothetical protein FRC07_004641, partial [Ceratobasidium sp. 392]